MLRSIFNFLGIAQALLRKTVQITSLSNSQSAVFALCHYLTMSHEKSFSKYIDNTISKGKLSYTKELFFLLQVMVFVSFWTFQKIQHKSYREFFLCLTHKSTLEKSSQRNRQLPALLEDTDCFLANHRFSFSEKFALYFLIFAFCFLAFVLCLLKTALL